MKITLEQAVKLLQKAGLADAEAAEASTDGDAIDFDEALSTIDNARTEFIKPKLTDDLVSQVKGKQGVYLRDTLSKMTGMTRNKLNAFDTDVDAIKGALDFWEQSIGKKPSELKSEMDSLIEAHNLELENLKTTYENQLSESTAKYNDRQINDYISGFVAELNLPEGADKTLVAKIAKNFLSDKVDFSIDPETNSVLALKKGTSTPAMNDAGTQMFDFKSAVENAVKPLGLIVEAKKVEDAVSVVNRLGNTEYKQANNSSQQAGSVAELNAARAKMFADANPA